MCKISVAHQWPHVEWKKPPQHFTISGIFNRRFNPGLVALKQAVDAGRFGKIAMADAYIKWYRDQAYYDSGQWRGTWELDGGGALMNQSIHAIDQLLYVAGPIKSVCASVATVAHERIEVEDTAVAILEFESGARGVIQGSTACWSKDGHSAEVQICGDKGSAFLADDKFRIWEFQEETEADERIRAELMISSGATSPWPNWRQNSGPRHSLPPRSLLSSQRLGNTEWAWLHRPRYSRF